MSFARESKKIVIAGASSLLGAELRSLLEESLFADADFRLVDEPTVAGTLTDVAGEPAVIQPLEEDSFDRARFIFFTGSADFTKLNFAAARKSGARVFDLSGGMAGSAEAVSWFPKLDELLGREFAREPGAYAVPSAAATAAAALTLALSKIAVQNLAFTSLLPVSESGRAGIEELESQTGQLLSFQSVGHPVFDTQVAFNFLDRFGPASRQNLATHRERVRRETKACLAEKVAAPAIQLLHAPVFYGTVFSASADFGADTDSDAIARACKAAGFVVTTPDEPPPSNVSAAGEKVIQLGIPQRDSLGSNTWWLWGSADNIRLPAANAVKLAEMLA